MALPTFRARSRSYLQMKWSEPIGTFRISTPSCGCLLIEAGNPGKEASPDGHHSSHFLWLKTSPRSMTVLLDRKSRIRLRDSLSPMIVPSSKYHTCSFNSGHRRRISALTFRSSKLKNSGPSGSPCWVPLWDLMIRPPAHKLVCWPQHHHAHLARVGN